MPSTESRSFFGERTCEELMFAVFIFNVILEVGALLLLLYTTFARVLLVYVLPGTGARLTFICQSNLPGNLSVAIASLVGCTGWVVGAARRGAPRTPEYPQSTRRQAGRAMCACVCECFRGFAQARTRIHADAGARAHLHACEACGTRVSLRARLTVACAPRIASAQPLEVCSIRRDGGLPLPLPDPSARWP